MPRPVALLLLLLTSSAAALEVPVDDLSKWTVLSFSKIRPNAVSVDNGALQVSVDSSASPLIYRFDEPVRVAGVTVTASWAGSLNVPPGATQGDSKADDFVLKFGIVEAGERRLNWLQRSIAADWIKQLFKLAPKGSGVERIFFLSTTQQQALLGTRRQHPLSDLLYEERVLYLDGPGDFELHHDFAEPVDTLGLWVSVDGDDTGSRFDLRITGISLRSD